MSSSSPSTTSSPTHGALRGVGVLVTGGGSGIGLAAALRLAADGAAVTICGRSETRLAEAEAAIAAHVPGATVGAVAADVTDETSVAAAVAAAHELAEGVGGRLAGVVASAGGSESIGPVTHLEIDA